MRASSLSFGLLLAFALSAGPLPAQEVELTEEPAVLTADEVVYDETLNLVLAQGEVRVSQGQRLLRADRVTYNQTDDIVTASGNVVLVEPGGEVLFAEYAELRGDLADGFIREVGLLLTDDSRLAANAGVRRAGRITQVERAVYSPCDLCPEEPDRAPLWQLRAAEVTHDSETLDITYTDAFLDIYGIPILYSPYLSHPDPRVERRTGFLAPTVGSSGDLGPFVIVPYYIDIAPEQDATVQLGLTRDAGAILLGEYRRRFETGIIDIEGSINRSERIVDFQEPSQRQEEKFRGHLFADARFDLNEHWRTGGTLNLVSDDTYLDIFNISDADVLRSRGYLEGFYGLSYAAAEFYGFRDLRQDSEEQAGILPWLTGNYITEPGAVFGGQGEIDASLVNYTDNPAGSAQTVRLSVQGSWQRDLYSDSGLLTSLLASLRGDVFWVDDLIDPVDPERPQRNETTSRLYPLAQVTARYPLVRQSEHWRQLIEPIASVTAAASLDDADDIPNNDSLAPEFDASNLFEADRFPGRDRVEEGVRLTYGLRTGLFRRAGGAASLFLGQSYRFDEEESFPDGSGLRDNLSDVVGRITLQAGQYLDLDYRFRYDVEDLASRRHEVRASGGVPIFRVATTYTFLDEAARFEEPEDLEEIVVAASSQLTDYWSTRASIRRDLADEETRQISFGVVYSDECFTVSANFLRDRTEDRDREDGNTIFFTVAFRNLGEPLRLGSSGLF